MNEPGQNSASGPADKRVDANQLSGVSETALATLNSRAYQAGLPNPLIHDPVAAKLVDAIDFDFGKFGRSQQGQELRCAPWLSTAVCTGICKTPERHGGRPWPKACRQVSGG